MPINRVKFADPRIHGVEINPLIRAHSGVIRFLALNKAAAIQVDAGYVICRTIGTPAYCQGYADSANQRTEYTTMSTPVLQVLDHIDSVENFEFHAALFYAEWLDGQRADADGVMFDQAILDR